MRFTRRVHRRLQRGAGAESGFTIVEVAVAIGIFGAVMLMISAMMAAGMRGVLLGKQRQVATHEASRVLEVARSLSYESIGLVQSDPTLAADPSVSVVSGSLAYLVDASEPAWEPIVWATDTSGHPYNPHTASFDRGSTRLTRYVYVTGVDSNGDGLVDLKRVTARVEWEARGTAGPDNFVVAQTLVSESGLVMAPPVPGTGCPTGASVCITGLTPMTASVSSAGGDLTVQAASGNLLSLLNAVLGDAPPVELSLGRTGGGTSVRGVQSVDCSVQGPGLRSPSNEYGFQSRTIAADTDPSKPPPSSDSYEWSGSHPVDGGEAADQLLVEAALAAQMSCEVDAFHPTDSLPYETGTVSGPSSLTYAQDITGAGLPSSVLQLLTMQGSTVSQTIDHTEVAGAREVRASAGGSMGQIRVLRIPGVLEKGLVQVSAFDYGASIAASEGTSSLPPEVSVPSGIGLLVYDPAAAVPDCDSRSAEYCVKQVSVAGLSGGGGAGVSLAGSVLRNSGLTKLTFRYSVTALPPSSSPTEGSVGPNGETTWGAEYTALHLTAELEIEVTVNLLLGLKVLLSHTRVEGTLGNVATVGCAGVGCV